MSSKPSVSAYVTSISELFAMAVIGIAAAFIAAPSTANDNSLTSAQKSNSAPNSAPEIESLPWRAEVVVGERLNLQITPHDDDNTVPVLSAEKLPDGSFLTDNRDGSRSLLWKPEIDQIGVHHIVFTATDSRNPELVTERILIINVLASAP